MVEVSSTGDHSHRFRIDKGFFDDIGFRIFHKLKLVGQYGVRKNLTRKKYGTAYMLRKPLGQFTLFQYQSSGSEDTVIIDAPVDYISTNN